SALHFTKGLTIINIMLNLFPEYDCMFPRLFLRLSCIPESSIRKGYGRINHVFLLFFSFWYVNLYDYSLYGMGQLHL
ncbi:hypothetical protein VIGAN_05016600, partial [Vigna angularis var. angularis]